MNEEKLNQLKMRCYCNQGKHKMDINHGICETFIPHKFHFEWSDDRDFICKDCLDKCGERV